MKHNAARAHRLPAAWQAAENAALRANAADTCDDRVSNDIFDVQDEREEVDIIRQAIIHGLH